MDGVLGFITLFAGDFAPRDWAFCDGSLVRISANTGLFSVIGNTYGGDGIKTFALPDLRGRAIIGAGRGISLYKPGETGGTGSRTVLGTKHIPAHTHPVQVTITPHAAGVTNSSTPKDSVYAINPGQPLYEFSANVKLATYTDKITTSTAGRTDPDPISIQHPVLALHYIICLNGKFPDRDH